MTTPAPKTPPSPTPWKCNPVPSTGTAGIVTGDGRLVGVVDIADGPRIVLAVNEHEALAGALREQLLLFEKGATRELAKELGVLDDFLIHGPQWLHQYVRSRARAILSRIEGAR